MIGTSVRVQSRYDPKSCEERREMKEKGKGESSAAAKRAKCKKLKVIQMSLLSREETLGEEQPSPWVVEFGGSTASMAVKRAP